VTRRPDFIIIGAMKCATSTLHEQLARQPGVFMSIPKEPNFFSDDAQWSRGVDWYTGLFDDAPADALCGESSTHYTKLPTHPDTVDRMRRFLSAGTRFIYVMRHPVDRLLWPGSCASGVLRSARRSAAAGTGAHLSVHRRARATGVGR
jgi:hypothetical protein